MTHEPSTVPAPGPATTPAATAAAARPAGPDRPVLFIAWTRNSGRSDDIAGALGGRARCIYPERLADRRLVLLRYAVSAVRTLVHLVADRPGAVIVTNPPVVPGVLVRAWSTLTGRPYVLDSHPVAFGAKDNAVARRLMGVHRWLARGARTTLVTTVDWVEVLTGWGAHGTVVHEAPPAWAPDVARSRPGGPATGATPGVGRRRVLFPGVFASDEPFDVVLEVARRLPDVDFHVTGDPARCPAHLREALPANVTLVGFVPILRFAAEVEAAHVVMALTTERTSVVRAGYEAVYSHRPLVVSDWPAAREAFPSAVFSGHDPDALVEALREAFTAHRQAPAVLAAAAAQQTQRWDAQAAALLARLSPAAPAGEASAR